jgi:hypothetical protein
MEAVLAGRRWGDPGGAEPYVVVGVQERDPVDHGVSGAEHRLEGGVEEADAGCDQDRLDRVGHAEIPGGQRATASRSERIPSDGG